MEIFDRKEYIEEIIATCIDIDPMAMYYVLERMNAKNNQSVDLMEKDANLSACVDEIIVGIDQSINHFVNSNQNQKAIFSNDLDRWIESQPELKYAHDHLTKWAFPHAHHDFVWFEKPFTGLEILQLEQLSKPVPGNQASVDGSADDFVWFEGSLDRWLDSQPDLKAAIDRLLDPAPADAVEQPEMNHPMRKIKVA